MAAEAKVGDKALDGVWEKIAAYAFEIAQDMTMEFQGTSCNIVDGEGKLVEQLDTSHGLVKRDVLVGYRCYVIRSWIKFEKKSA